MNRSFAVLLLLVTSVLVGCAAHPAPQLRPYTAEETRQLALEALSRRGLSFDEYQQQRAALTGQSPKPSGFDRHGEMNAERGVKLLGRAS
ncbi:hypothetical protein [Pseudomonas trivialis]|uniref:Lipoprotein n=1 Tax=Pseudomonas trivialis TaxID=200450 RepID=A0A0R2ZN91_9PSED|nr:hypothetical protein [Pseudomonas trivialis]KRP59947.1 lipoprotein [Pseudomonas trivialis]SDS67231.1 hypothetical protein SAMN04490205_3242 [Pseudomonas trivialis]